MSWMNIGQTYIQELIMIYEFRMYKYMSRVSTQKYYLLYILIWP